MSVTYMLRIFSTTDEDTFLLIDNYNNFEIMNYRSYDYHYLYTCRISDDFEENTQVVSIICLDDENENAKLQQSREYRSEVAFFLEFAKFNIIEQYACYDLQKLRKQRICERFLVENDDFYNNEYRNAIKRAKKENVFRNRY